MGRTVVVTTQVFTGTDGANVSADTNWLDQNPGYTAQLRIISNGYHSSGNIADCCWQGAGSFTDDQYFETQLLGAWTQNDNDQCGGVLRSVGVYGASPTNSCYRVVWQPSLNGTSGAAQVYKVVNGNNGNLGTQLGANINFTMAPNDLLSAEAVANGGNVDILVYKNNVLQGTRSDTASVLTGGKPGPSASGFLNLRGDNMVLGNVTGIANGTASILSAVATGAVGTALGLGRPPPPYSIATITG